MNNLENKNKRIFLSFVFLSIFFIFAGCSMRGGQLYKDDEYGFSFRYSSNWYFLNLSGNKFLVKKPVTQNDIENGKITSEDCVLRISSLDNPSKKNLDEFWADKSNKEKIRWGDNNFTVIKYQNKDITYSIINNKKQIIVFEGTENCQKDNKDILSTITLN